MGRENSAAGAFFLWEGIMATETGKKVCFILDECCNKLDVLGKGFRAIANETDKGDSTHWDGLAGFCKDLSEQISNASDLVDGNNL